MSPHLHRPTATTAWRAYVGMNKGAREMHMQTLGSKAGFFSGAYPLMLHRR